MAALDFPPSSESPFIAPNGVVYVWNDDGYWEADTSEVPSSDNTFLKLDASNDPITGNLTITGGLDVTTKVTSASTTDVDSGDTLVTKDYLNQTTSDAVFWERSGDDLYPKTLTDKVGIGTNSPLGQLDVRGANFGNNQNVGITLGLPDGQWMTGQFLRSNESGVPRLAFDVPITGTGSTKEAISVNNLGNVSIGNLFTDSNVSVDIGNFDSPGSSTAGVKAYSGGAIYIRRNNDNPIFRGYGNNSSAINSEITNTGQAFFRDKVGVGTLTPFSKLDVRTDDQYDGINLRQTDGTKIAELAGLNIDNDWGSLSLYINADKDTLIRAGVGDNWIKSGSLGIGTKTPSSRLEVSEYQAALDESAVKVLSLSAANDGSNNFRYLNFYAPGVDNTRVAKIEVGNSTAPLTFDVNGEERLRIDKDGDVGIATSLPNAKLEVATDALGEGLRISRGTDTQANQYIDLSASSGGNRITCSYNDAGQKNLTFFMRNHDLGTNNAAMHITPDLNVGIGTETPSAKLTVNGDILAGINTVFGQVSAPNHLGTDTTANIQVNSQSDISPSISLNHARSNGLGSAYFAFNKAGGNLQTPTILPNNVDIGSLVFNGFDGTDYLRAAQITAAVDGTAAAGSVSSRIMFFTTADGESSPTERMRIDSSGNVGITADAPTANLEIGATGVAGVPAIYLSKPRPASTTTDIAIAGGAVIRTGSGQNYIGGSGGYFRWMLDPADDGTKVKDGLDGAVEMMRLDGSGNITLGGTLPNSPNISLNANGSATFKGAITLDDGTHYSYTGPTGYAAVLGSTLLSNEHPAIQVTSRADTSDIKARINGDGTASFLGDDIRLGITGTGGNARATLNLISPDTISAASGVFYVTRAGTTTVKISSGGSADFAGTVIGNSSNSAAIGGDFRSNSTDAAQSAVQARQFATGGLCFQGIDSSGNVTFSVTDAGVISGSNVTFDADTADAINVRDRLVEARETFEQLKAAVNGASDFAGLKSALLTALADFN